jgi:inorganic triphosphatase YgiF
MADEVELKLTVAPERAAAVRHMPLLRRLAEKRAVTRQLNTVYFDTPNQALAQRGIVLRIRSLGRRRVQTIKLPSEGLGGLQVLREIETTIAGDRPELDKIADLRLRRLFADKAITRGLVPLFTTEFRRTVWPLRFNESLIELAFDQGEIRAKSARLPISEIELELRNGRPEHLFELALAVHEGLPVTMGSATKAARGYALLADAEPAPAKASAVGLVAAMTARDAFSAAARSCLAQMRANEAPARLGKDPEGIHQLRVGLRRLRALATAYRDTLADNPHEYLSRELRWLQQELNPARDWDVFIATTLTPIAERMTGVRPGLDAADELRALAQTRACATLDSPRYTALLLRCYSWLATGAWASTDAAILDRPVGDFASTILNRRHRRLRKFGGKRADMSEAELHRLRLMAKKQRYVGEFFRELYPRKATGKYIAALAAIQDVLGSLNDALVSRHLVEELERFLAGVPSLGPTAAARGAGIILGWQAARIAEDMGKVSGVWKGFLERKAFWPRPQPWGTR